MGWGTGVEPTCYIFLNSKIVIPAESWVVKVCCRQVPYIIRRRDLLFSFWNPKYIMQVRKLKSASFASSRHPWTQWTDDRSQENYMSTDYNMYMLYMYIQLRDIITGKLYRCYYIHWYPSKSVNIRLLGGEYWCISSELYVLKVIFFYPSQIRMSYCMNWGTCTEIKITKAGKVESSS